MTAPGRLLWAWLCEAWSDWRSALIQIIIPADERLEERAHAILRRGSDAQRPTAINALRFFKSDENIHMLEGALGDPDYSVRSYAYQALKHWAIDVAEPPSHE